MIDLSDTLGVDRDATPAELRAAFRRWAAAHHPDRGGSTEAFAAVSAEVHRYRHTRHLDVEIHHATPGRLVRRWARRRWRRGTRRVE